MSMRSMASSSPQSVSPGRGVRPHSHQSPRTPRSAATAAKSSSAMSPSSPLLSSSRTMMTNPRSVNTPPVTLPPELNSLPYMTERELVAFLKDRPYLILSPEDREYLFLRRRRMSLDMAHSASAAAMASMRVAAANIATTDPMVPGAVAPSNVVKIVILGDEETTGKEEWMHLATLPDSYPSDGGLPPVDILRHPMYYHDARLDSDHMSSQLYELEMWLPSCGTKYDSLRPHYYPATDLFLVLFSVRNRSSFDSVRERWAEEINKFTLTQTKREVPVILIGNHAETRKLLPQGRMKEDLVDPQEAVELAQQMGFMKYIEVFSDNRQHIAEVLRQGVREIVRSRLENPRMAPDDYRAEFIKEDTILRRHLSLPEPVGFYDPFKRCFIVDPVQDVTFVYTLDGSEPTRYSALYEGPIKLRRPYPEGIRVMALSRCRYSSRAAYFRVPEETPPPHGHFDLVPIYEPRTHESSVSTSSPVKSPSPLVLGSFSSGSPSFGFVFTPADGTRIFYTLDGTRPTVESDVALGGYLRLPVISNDNGDPNQPYTLPMVRAIAVRDGLLASRVADFAPPVVLPTPLVRFDTGTRILSIEAPPLLRSAPQSASSPSSPDGPSQSYFPLDIEYRYTVDGSEPSYSSLLYAGPVMITGHDVVIRVASFPRLSIPSRIVTFVASGGASSSPAPVLGNDIGTGVDAVRTIRLSERALQGAGGSGSPRRVRGDGASIMSLNEPSIPVRERKLLRSPSTPRDVHLNLRQKPLSHFYSEKNNGIEDMHHGTTSSFSPRGNTSSPGVVAKTASGLGNQSSAAPASPRASAASERPTIVVEPQQQPGASPLPVETRDLDRSMVSCSKDGNALVFSFTVPAQINRVVVCTPGRKTGPASIRCSINGGKKPLVDVSLDDVEGNQEVLLETALEAADPHGHGIRSLRCEFRPFAGQSSFKLRDIRVVGTTAAAPLQ